MCPSALVADVRARRRSRLSSGAGWRASSAPARRDHPGHRRGVEAQMHLLAGPAAPHPQRPVVDRDAADLDRPAASSDPGRQGGPDPALVEQRLPAPPAS